MNRKQRIQLGLELCIGAAFVAGLAFDNGKPWLAMGMAAGSVVGIGLAMLSYLDGED